MLRAIILLKTSIEWKIMKFVHKLNKNFGLYLMIWSAFQALMLFMRCKICDLVNTDAHGHCPTSPKGVIKGITRSENSGNQKLN